MKKETHPILMQSVVQMKDGAAYVKKWLFFRPTLQLEVDYTGHPFWRKTPKNIKVITNKKK